MVSGNHLIRGAVINIRIISGEYGGRKIEAPDTTQTHPMGERIRNALFNIIGDEVKEASILDAFAGTGSIGLEALSRGARNAVFIEKDRTAQTFLAKNVTTLGATERSTIVRTTVDNWLNNSTENKFNIIFADPPYQDLQLSTVARLFGLLKVGGLMILSHSGKGEAPTRPGVVVVDNRSYGTAVLTFYRREDV